MGNVTITINGDINIFIDSDAESFIRELVSALCGDDEDDLEDGEERKDDVLGDTTFAVIFPEGIDRVSTFGECSHLIDEMTEACEFHVIGEKFILVFERKGLITMSGKTYLVARAIVFFCEDEGNTVSYNADALKALEAYLTKNRTEIFLGRYKLTAIRLEGEICEGV